MRHRYSGWAVVGRRQAACPQYSNSSRWTSVACFSRVRGYGPSRANSWQLVRPHEDVDGVDLDQSDPVEQPAQMAPVDPPGGAGVGETLGRERDAPGRRRRQAGE